MAKKSRLKKGYKSSGANSAIGDMKYIDLQRAVIIRGMDFDSVVSGDFPRLATWLNKNWGNKRVTSRLDDFDNWRKDLMRKRGLDEDEPFIRLGFIGDPDPETGETTFKRPRKIKKEKVKRERTDQGLFKGTKKELTFKCAVEDNLSLQETVEIVTDKFPEGVEKSIRIWYNKGKKAKK